MSAWRSAVAALCCGMLAACSTLSGSGPAATALRRTLDVDIVPVTPALAEAAHVRTVRDQQAALQQALEQLRDVAPVEDFRLAPGDVVEVSIWTFSPWPGSTAPPAAGPGQIQLGSFTIEPDGAVALPYAGRMTLARLTPPQAQQAIAARYTALRILLRPTALVKVAASPHSDVLVTGAVGQPKQIPWTPAGLTLAQAVTQALGDGNATLAQGDLSSTRAAVRVSVVRRGAMPAEIPVGAAFTEDIALRPGDRVVVRERRLFTIPEETDPPAVVRAALFWEEHFRSLAPDARDSALAVPPRLARSAILRAPPARNARARRWIESGAVQNRRSQDARSRRPYAGSERPCLLRRAAHRGARPGISDLNRPVVAFFAPASRWENRGGFFVQIPEKTRKTPARD